MLILLSMLLLVRCWWGWTERQTGHTDRIADRQNSRQTDRQTDGQIDTERQTDICADKQTHLTYCPSR